MTRVTVSVPATTANLGPGFDCLGMALKLYNKVTFEHVAKGLTIELNGEGAGQIPTDENNLVYQAAQRLFQLLGRRPAGLMIRLDNDVPASSGLGSSASAVVAGLVGANALINGGLTRGDLVDLAAEMEGHADNVAPAIYGGLVLSNKVDGPAETPQYHIECIPTPSYKVALVLPDVNLSTRDARALLPVNIPRADAVFNIGRMGLLIRALMLGDCQKLSVAMQDRIHQPFRTPLIPGFAAAIKAAEAHGSISCALSGAGPSIVVFTEGNHAQINADIQAAFAEAGIASRAWILESDHDGVQIQSQ